MPIHWWRILRSFMPRQYAWLWEQGRVSERRCARNIKNCDRRSSAQRRVPSLKSKIRINAALHPGILTAPRKFSRKYHLCLACKWTANFCLLFSWIYSNTWWQKGGNDCVGRVILCQPCLVELVTSDFCKILVLFPGSFNLQGICASCGPVTQISSQTHAPRIFLHVRLRTSPRILLGSYRVPITL